MEITPCKPYHAKSAGTALVRMLKGPSVFKVYYVDIVGRDDPSRYEWDHSGLGRSEFEATLKTASIEGVGFVTAFPHITKVFRFAPAVETVLHVTAFNTKDLSPLPLDRGSGWVEFACYAEAVIAAAEYDAWAEADTVETYLDYRCDFDDAPIQSADKLSQWWTSQAKEN